MRTFSAASVAKLQTCDPRLVALFTEVLKHWDCTIICGHRGKDEQDEAFRTGKSKTPWPTSKHNSLPSRAVDVGPFYPVEGIPWNDKERFRMFGGFVMGVASQMGIKVRYGGDWDGDWVINDQKLVDLPHFELMD